MDWESDFGGGSSYFELPSWDVDYTPEFSSDIWSGGGNTFVDSYDPWSGLGADSWISSYVSPEVFSSYQPSQTFSQGALGIPQPQPQPQGAMNVTAPQQGSIWDRLLSPQGLLGLGSGAAGLIGALAGGGQGATVTPKMSTQQKAQIGYANQALGGLQPFIAGTTPLQTQQASLLNAIASGQGLAAPYAQAIERAFEPQMGNLYEQAVRAGRARGFHDAPAQSPAGGAILGPGLSDLQGQIAAAKIKAMFDMPQLYNQPVQTQAQLANAFATGNTNLFNAFPTGQTTSQPLGPQIGNAVAGALGGLGQVFGTQDQNAQKAQRFDDLLAVLGRMQPSMSNA